MARPSPQPFNPVLTTLAGLGALFFVLPLVGLLVQTPWRSAPAILADPGVASALELSLIASLASTALACLLGVPLAWVLARLRFPGKGLLRGITTLPMVLPPVVGGVALLLAFGRRGLIGGPPLPGRGWSAIGAPLPGATTGSSRAWATDERRAGGEVARRAGGRRPAGQDVSSASSLRATRSMRSVASRATPATAGLSTTASAASGSRKRATVPPSADSRTTLQGSRTPTAGSASRARWARRGLQAPRIR